MSFCILSTLPFYFLFLLLLLLASCSLFILVCTAELSVSTEPIKLFTIDKLKTVVKNGESTSDSVTVESFGNIFLVATNEIMVALAETTIKKNPAGSDVSNNAVDLVAEYIVKEEGEKWESKIANKDGNNWKMLLAVDSSDGNQKEIFSNKKGSAVVTNDNKIYFFVVKDETPNGNNKLTAFIKNLNFVLVIGEEQTEEGQGKTISWKNEKNVKLASYENIIKQSADKITDKISSIASVNCYVFLVAGEEKVVFVLKGKFEEDKQKNIILFFQLKKSTENTLELFHVEIVADCEVTFFQSKDKIMMIPTSCNSNSDPEIKESSNLKEWTKSNGLFSLLLDSLKDKTGLITTTNDGKPILFFSQKKSEEQKCFTYLWISDGIRMTCVGEIASDDKIYIEGSLLYTNDELFFLYKKTASDINTKEIEFKHHKELEKNITNVLNKWKENYALVLALCGNNQESAKITCGTQLPTDGLVGFLSGDTGGDNTKWEDNYDYVTATVNGGKKVKGGFEFSGASAGALWDVSKESKYNLYNFAKYGFTLLSTLTIDKAAKEENFNSVLGVCVTKGGSPKKCFGLWCTAESYWGMSGLEGSNIVKTNKNCNKGKRYVVEMTLKDKNIVVYVDGDKLTAALTEKFFAKIEDETTISYFYFGMDTSVEKQSNRESHMTVQNVLLYNQPFAENRFKDIKAINVENPVEPDGSVQSSMGEGESSTEIDERNTYGDGTTEITNTLLPTEEIVVTTSQRESAVHISVSVMCSVWLMLFVATHYQYV